jgi:uncharacterized protein YdeI (YjbR/CyaY-like superfamily)
MKIFHAGTIDGWRDWLADHHESETEVWLVFYKQHTGVPSVDYQDAVDEALCVGWVDSLIKRLDDRRYARKFTPRRTDSVWSATNRTRYAALKAEGRMKPGGLGRPPTSRKAIRPPRFKMPAKLPGALAAALKKNPDARRCFDGLSDSHRCRYVWWIDSAKREDTKARRLKEAIRFLTAGRPLGLK